MSDPPPTWQFACIAYIPLLTANLSVVGSGLIIYSILGIGRSTKLRKPHQRLLLAMSIYDMCYSLATAWTFLLAPAGYGVPGAQGNMTTCRLQGFFVEITHGTGAYNALLSLYFYLSIVRGVKPSQFAKYEPFAHALIFVIFVGFGATGVAIKLFNPAFSFCFIASYPPGCESGPGAPPCERFPPQTIGLLYQIFAQMWIQIYIVIVAITNILTWYHVRQQENVIRENSSRYSMVARLTEISARDSSVRSMTRSGRALMKKKVNRERMVAVQSTLYVAVFILCWIGPTVFHLAGWIGNFQSFWAALVAIIFTPLQGFWNAFIFARPTYLRIRRKNESLSGFEAAKMVFFDPNPLRNANTAKGVGGPIAANHPSRRNEFIAQTKSVRFVSTEKREDTEMADGDKHDEETFADDDRTVIAQSDSFEFDDCIDDYIPDVSNNEQEECASDGGRIGEAPKIARLNSSLTDRRSSI